MNTKTREITEGAMVVAIMGVFLLIDKYLANMLQGYLFFLMPLPTLIFASKYGLKKSIVVVVAVILTGFIVASESILSVAIYAVLGFVYGSGVYAKKNNTWLLVSAFAVCLVEYIISMIVLPKIYGYNIYDEFVSLVEVFQTGLDAENAQLVQNVIIQLFPAILVICAALEAFMMHLLSHLILKRLRIDVPELTGLGMMQMPAGLGRFLLFIWLLGWSNGVFRYLPDYVETGYAIATVIQMIFYFFGYIIIVIVSKMTGQKILVAFGIAAVFFFNTALFILGAIDSISPSFRLNLMERYLHKDEE